ncbi:MAG: sugar ABC transporter permease [Acidimicrobiia bacterium]|nr:sugar ABC transporter permease [Acidimicrobiia bacterium]
MTTPPVIGEEELEGGPRGLGPPEQEHVHTVGVWLLRVASALVLPAVVIAFFFIFGFLKDEEANKAIQVVVAIIAGIGGVWALYWGMDRLVSMFPERIARAVRPFAFVGPAMAILAFYLVYPAINTILISFQDKRSEAFVGLENYTTIFTDSFYLVSIRNSVIWVLVVPAAAVAIGLAFATMADKLSRRAESITKSLIFLPMAISFVGASVVWTFVYGFRPEGFGNQIGVLNGIVTSLGGSPVNWLQTSPWNNLFLMIILIWLQTGFSMVILSSAIKGVPDVLLEAARIDGATEWQAFWRITFPSISSTVVVVWTTVVITVWKVFDIVWVMTGGLFDTQVIAQTMVDEFFTNFNFGIGAALAVLLFIAVVPILIVNVQRFRAQEAIR